MALESATYISDLNVSNPAAGDGAAQGDDHLRLIKATLKATFPNVTGAVTLSHTELNAILGRLTSLELSGAQVGDLKHTARASASSGWALCYGQALSRTTYSALFAAIGTTFGSGDGVSTFNVPDLRGRTLVGLDNMGGTSAGRVSGVLGAVGTTLGGVGGDQYFQAHSHGVTDPGHTHTGSTDAAGSHTHTGTTASSGAHSHTVTGGSVLSVASSGAIIGAGGATLVSGSTDTQGSHTHTFTTDAGGSHSHNITMNSSTTGISIVSAGTGSSQNLMPLSLVNIVIYTGV